jgi:hypothetical protein
MDKRLSTQSIPHYTITASMGQELEDWVRSQPESRNQLVLKALQRLRDGDTPFLMERPENEAVLDPYGWAMRQIAATLEMAHRYSGGMSQGEFSILGVIASALLEEDPALHTVSLQEMANASRQLG